MTNEITNANLGLEMIKAIPELHVRMRMECEFWDGEKVPSAYDLFGFVLKPYLKNEILSTIGSEASNRVFGFIDRACASQDPEVRNAVWIRIIEWIMANESVRVAVAGSLGPNTKALLAEATVRWENIREGHEDIG